MCTSHKSDRELDGCEVGALVATALEEADHFSVNKFLQPYPLGPAKEVGFVREVVDDDVTECFWVQNPFRAQEVLWREKCPGFAGSLVADAVLTMA